MLAELEQVLGKLREEVNVAREKNRALSRMNQNEDYAKTQCIWWESTRL